MHFTTFPTFQHFAKKKKKNCQTILTYYTKRACALSLSSFRLRFRFSFRLSWLRLLFGLRKCWPLPLQRRNCVKRISRSIMQASLTSMQSRCCCSNLSPFSVTPSFIFMLSFSLSSSFVFPVSFCLSFFLSLSFFRLSFVFSYFSFLSHSLYSFFRLFDFLFLYSF